MNYKKVIQWLLVLAVLLFMALIKTAEVEFDIELVSTVGVFITILKILFTRKQEEK